MDTHADTVRRQERVLEDYAKREGIWFKQGHFPERLYLGRGGEARVYQKDANRVVKLIDPRQIDKSLTPQKFLDNRISLFNHLFPESHYELMGFMRDGGGKFRFIVTQPLVQGRITRTQADIDSLMEAKGLHRTGRESYANDLYQVHDLHVGNVLKDADGTVYVINAVPKMASESLYKPLSVSKSETLPLFSIGRETPRNDVSFSNFVVGSEFTATFPVFTGSFRNAKFSHNVDIEGVIRKESYGADRGQHTFTFEVTKSSDEKEFAVGKTYRKKGRNLYPNAKITAQPDDYTDVAADKAERAVTQSAKAKREERRYEEEKRSPLFSTKASDTGEEVKQAALADGYLEESDFDEDGRVKPEVKKEIAEERKRIETDAKANGTYLKAPNGKDSNLTPHQWVEVRTRRFKKWFGDWENLAKIKTNLAKINSLLSADANSGQWENLGTVTPTQAQAIRKATGLDVVGYKHVLDKSAINHIKRRHGDPDTEANKQQAGITDEDIKLVPLVLTNPDKIAAGAVNSKKLATILYEKAIDGTVVVVEEVRTGRKSLAVSTVYKKNRGSGSLLSPSAQTSKTTSSDTSTIHNISDLIQALEKDVSKVRDENGEPMVVYHGTGADFDTFRPDKSVYNTYWFTNDPDEASLYANQNGGGNLIPSFISTKNPADWEAYDKKFISELSGEGYDGVVLKDGDNTSVIAFSPTQIKSAISNLGTYSQDQPSMLRSGRAASESPEARRISPQWKRRECCSQRDTQQKTRNTRSNRCIIKMSV